MRKALQNEPVSLRANRCMMNSQKDSQHAARAAAVVAVVKIKPFAL